MKISNKTKMRLKKYLAEMLISIFGYAWIVFTYGSFVCLVIIDYNQMPLALFLTGQFSFILCLLGFKAYQDYKETEEFREMDLAESKRLEDQS